MNAWLLLTSIVATFGIIVAIVVWIALTEFDQPQRRRNQPRLNLIAPDTERRQIGRLAYQLHRQGKAWNRIQAIYLARMVNAIRITGALP